MTVEKLPEELNLNISVIPEVERVYNSLRYPFPYTPENFTDEENEVLLRYFTNTNSPVYAITNTDQEVAGALLSRFSRAKESPRRIFLKEFYGDPVAGVKMIKSYLQKEMGIQEEIATIRAKDLYETTLQVINLQEEKGKRRKGTFYKRVLAEYGDDSVIQMGSVHLIFEDVSQIAAKAIEDNRTGAAYIEKSTRYVEFDQKVEYVAGQVEREQYVKSRYLYTDVPEITRSEFAEVYEEWNNACFEAYARSIDPTKEFLRGRYPIESVTFTDKKTEQEISFAKAGPEIQKTLRTAYENALRAKALDLVRLFLPTTTVTNLGAHYSGQSAEHAINKMLASPHQEVQMIGLMALEEASKVIPSFLERVPGKHGRTERNYLREAQQQKDEVGAKWLPKIERLERKDKVRLVDWDKDVDVRIASQILYTSQKGTDRLSKREIIEWARKVKKEELEANTEIWWSPTLAQIIQEAVPDRQVSGRNRRQKLPRAFEQGYFEVEVDSNFGIYRDLQRNRLGSTERQRLSAEEVDTPQEFFEPGMEQVLADYENIASRTRDLHGKLLGSDDESVSRSAEYMTILGNRLRFNIRANVRQWCFLSELRTIEGGHRDYRWDMQNAARQILHVAPFLKPLFAHVNWAKDFGLGRLKAEIKTQEKLAQIEKSERDKN